MKNRIYTIQVLEDKDYDVLHEIYPRIKKKDLEDSLGFADVEKGEAYVRKTNVALLDESTMQHELQELLAKTSPHEENGIRWKKGKNIFSNIIPLVVGGIVTALTGGGAAPFVGKTMASILGGAASAGTSAITQKNMSSAGTISPLTTALSGVGSGLMGKGIISGVNAAKEAGGGILGQTLSGIQGAVGITPGAMAKPISGLQGPVTQAQSQLGYSNLSQVPQSILGSAAAESARRAASGLVGPATASQAAKGYASLAQVPTSQITNPRIIGTGLGVSSGTGGITQTNSQTEKAVLDKFGGIPTKPETILGGASLLGSMAPKTPKFEMPSTIADLRSKIMSGEAISPLGQQARSSLADILKAKPQELYPTANDAYFQAATRRTEEAYTQAQKNLDAAYNNAGVYGSGEHLAEKAKLDEQLARTKSGLASEIEQRRFELARNEQYQAIQTSLGVDRDTMDDLVGITGLSAELTAQMYGADVADVIVIRQALGSLGSELLVRGISGSSAQSGVTQQ